MENWKVIEEFESYEVSDLGRVKRVLPGGSHCAVVGNILTPVPDSNGYLQVCVSDAAGHHSKSVHRLVAKAFIPNPMNLPQINHKGEMTDNRAEKLEWISQKNHAMDLVLRDQRGDGVYFDKAKGKYAAQYNRTPGKHKHIGFFLTYIEAKTARDEKVKEIAKESQ